MKAVYEMTCKCCEADGKPARTRVEVEGEDISATCETHGPWMWFRPENHAEILAMHRAALVRAAAELRTCCAHCGAINGGHTMACQAIHEGGPKPAQVSY